MKSASRAWLDRAGSRSILGMRLFLAILIILVLVVLDRAYMDGQNAELIMSLVRRGSHKRLGESFNRFITSLIFDRIEVAKASQDALSVASTLRIPGTKHHTQNTKLVFFKENLRTKAERCSNLGSDREREIRKFFRNWSSDFLDFIAMNGMGEPPRNGGAERKTMTNFAESLREESGGTAIEYGLIIAGISVAIVGAVNALGSGLNTTFSTIIADLASAGK
jgi:pilus assembly protein Flp/PilA